MAKKKKMTKTVITPKVPLPLDSVKIEDLEVGDKFIDGGDLLMLFNADPEAVNLDTGQQVELSYDVSVQPVNCKISWGRKKI